MMLTFSLLSSMTHRKCRAGFIRLLLLAYIPSLLALDIQVQNQPLKDVVTWLAAETGANIVIDPQLDQSVTLLMRNTNWQSVLELLALQYDLQLRWQQDTALLGPAVTPVIVDPVVSSATTAECETLFWVLQHAKAQDVGEHLSKLYAQIAFSVDSRTNAIVARICESSTEFQQTLKRLDSPLRQIEISARIVQMRSNAQSQLGVNWQIQATDSASSLLGGAVDLAAINPSSALSFAITKGERLLSLTLDLLETRGEADILSQPKIVTAEGQTATIESGTEVPYQSKDDNGVKVEFKQAGLMLQVTPSVKDDHKIQLALKIHQDAVGDLVNGIPSLETNRVQTQVVVADQETLVLGGIYRQERLSSESKVPFWGDLPILGALFKRQIERQEKVELLVFITPKLLQMTHN